jgi:hypothetical protein
MIRPFRSLALGLVLTAALTGAVLGIGLAFGRALSPWGTLALMGAAVTAISAARRLRVHDIRHRGRRSPKPTSPRPFLRVLAIRQRLMDVDRPSFFDDRVRALLVELAADRLRRNHGIDWSRHPQRARKVAGDEVLGLLRGEPLPSPDLRKVELLVRRIEAL